jgi:hypothetical protein
MRHAPTPAVQLPYQHPFELLEPSIAEELIEPRPTGSGPAESRIYILCKDLPALFGDVLTQFVELHLAALVRSAHSGVNGDDHGL